MGMRDESWCNGCGTSVPYSENEETFCGTCAEDYAQQTPQKLVELIEYMKLHLISLEQDSEKIWNAMDQIDDLESDEYESLNIEDIRNGGEQSATRHLLSVARDILLKTKGN